MSDPGPARRSEQRRTLTGVGAGNAMEWFDWNIYATFSVFFSSQFFAGTDSGVSLLKALAVFAVGFVARPFGGFVFGWIADRRGRRTSMAATVAVAAGGSLVIAVIPTYATIGIGAPALLVLARLAQGLAHGGELPAAQTYLAEMAPAARRGRWSSLIYVSGSLGVLAGSLLGAVLAGLLSPEQMTAFGWRIPFLVGGLFGLYALVMRLRMRETGTYREHAREQADTSAPRPSVWRAMLAQPGTLARVVLLTSGLTVVYYVWAAAAPAYVISAKGVDPATALWATSAATGVFVLALPVWGALSDRFGRRPVMLVPLALLVPLLYPLDAMITTSGWSVFLAVSVALLLIGAGSAILPAVFAEMFPTGIRAAGLGVPYSIAVALFGGTAPYLQTLFAQQGHPGLFTGYAAVLLVVTCLSIWFLPETAGRDLSTVGERVRDG